MKDTLGDRMKSYEDCYRIKLPKRSYVMIRVDGKAFHTYTKGLNRPFDVGLIDDMNETAAYLCKNMMGAKFAYVQSDEISILLTDFENIDTQAWFDNNLQKMVSVAASFATSKFNQMRLFRYLNKKLENETTNLTPLFIENINKIKQAEFDARVWILPNQTEVINYLIWRQQDATRNSISSVAQSLYSHKQLMGKSSDEKQEMIFQKGTNWNDYPVRMKRGGFIDKIQVEVENKNPEPNTAIVFRSKWMNIDCPIFSKDKGFLEARIPLNY